MSRKLPSIGELNSKRLKPISVSKQTPISNGGDSKRSAINLNSQRNTDQFYEDNLKDYDSLLSYCMKLIEENKQLLTENSDLRRENEEVLTSNIELLDESSALKQDKDKLVDDSLIMINYNEQLHEDKSEYDAKYIKLQENFDHAISFMTADSKAKMLKKHPDIMKKD